MATQTVEFRAAPGLSLTVRLFAIGSDPIVGEDVIVTVLPPPPIEETSAIAPLEI